MPRRLNLYIARRFSAALALILAASAGIVLVAEYIEALRRFGDKPEFTAGIGLRIALLRVPLVLDDILPFAFLFAGLLSLLGLSGKLELVIARASGVSVWGFLRAPAAVALIFGALATAIFNPLAVQSRDASQAIAAELSGPGARRDEGHWFRQDSAAGASIVYSNSVGEGGRALVGVTAIVLDGAGKFREKVTAARADFDQDRWILAGARIVSAASAPTEVPRYELQTEITPAELQRTVVRPRAVSIWSLPGYIKLAERTGIESDPFRLAFHTLLNRPLFLIAMVTVAATVSLRLTRYGGTWRLVLTGVAIGFLLYVITAIMSDLGGHGIVDPILAAWLPPIAALTFGATALLYQEDG
jgi:lipopolysaccharide export system permease protein